MKITDLNNLFVATYDDDTTHFNALVVALDETEAHEIAVTYFQDAQFCDNVEELMDSIDINEFTDIDTKFDCDYALTYSEEF